MLRTLYSDLQVTVTIDDAPGVVRYTRSSEPYPSIEAVREQHGKLAVAMATLPSRSLQLLIDVREAPPRNDDAFEAELMRALAVMMPKFAMHASLVKTAVGRLQAARVAKARGGDPVVFTDEAEALEYLRLHRPG